MRTSIDSILLIQIYVVNSFEMSSSWNILFSRKKRRLDVYGKRFSAETTEMIPGIAYKNEDLHVLLIHKIGPGQNKKCLYYAFLKWRDTDMKKNIFLF